MQPSAGNQLSTVISYATVGGNSYESDDRIFDNNVTPNFKPEKYALFSEPSFDIIGNKLADDDDYELIKLKSKTWNGKTLKRGQKIYYQVWLDTHSVCIAKAESHIFSFFLYFTWLSCVLLRLIGKRDRIRTAPD